MSKKLACIILAAGKGTRMKSDLPKPLHPIAGKPMVNHIIDACKSLNADRIVTVISPDTPVLEHALENHSEIAVQSVANGTGGAALAAKEHLNEFDGDILIVFGDTPLIKTKTLRDMITARHAAPDAGLVFSAFEAKDPTGYGRMVLNEDGTLDRIVEHKDASEDQHKITLCNGGAVCADGTRLFGWLEQIGNDNAQGEYYLPDLPQIARRENCLTRISLISEEETAGVNSRKDQAKVEALMQNRLRAKIMDEGVTLIDPSSVYFSMDTKIEKDVTVHPNVVFGPHVKIESGVTIMPFTHLEGCVIRKEASVGPYARIRPGTDVGEHAKIGNFVETKKAKIGRGSKASHLSYIGDAEIGNGVNIGAGTITCNYDGFNKYVTEIGDGAFIGSNTALVAPIVIGAGAMTAAGSTITKDVKPDALGLARSKQTVMDGWAKDFRSIKEKK
jgi:bifunctional UDP-N-acetylglucosamine pyrophosphorylase/glucosamine-1-phosphate N-acetyltransferase